MVKQRKIQKKDWKLVEQQIKDDLNDRQTSQFRKDHERVWKEVDRQIKMEPMKRINAQGEEMKPSWNSAFELGELSKVSEIISADVMRITFPDQRDWFESHVEIQKQIDEETGEETIDEERQSRLDDGVRSLMTQQHLDFAFEGRVELSVKEALHHGSYVVEVDWSKELMVRDGSKVKELSAPIWIPHSMWNSYPDPSPRVVAPNMFYNGSMIITSYMKKHKLKSQTGPGWMPAQIKKVPDEDNQNDKVRTKDPKLTTYFGDLVIERSGENIFLPNCKAILANGVIVYWDILDLPYPPIIYSGYEKQDVRDPYYTSPIIKQSPMSKMATILANKFVDGISLKVEPPIAYDGNDPYFVSQGGPAIYPGAKTPTKGSTAYQQIEIGDPTWALNGLEMALRQMQEGTGVNAVRSGVPNSDRQTATEVNKIEQGGEVRTVDFIKKLVRSLRSFLYMQHSLNLLKLKEYTYYSDNMDTSDFVRVTGSQLKMAEVAHFDVVGAKAILGEEQRSQRMTGVTAFASGNPLFAPLLKPKELLINMYKDAGTKNPERFVNAEQEQEDPRIAEMQQGIQELQGALQEAEAKTQLEMAKLEQKREEAIGKAEAAREKNQSDAEAKQKDLIANYSIEIQKMENARILQQNELLAEFRGIIKDVDHKMQIMKMEANKEPMTVNINELTEAQEKQIGDLSRELSEVKSRVGKKKRSIVKFIDDDTAEVVDEEELA